MPRKNDCMSVTAVDGSDWKPVKRESHHFTMEEGYFPVKVYRNTGNRDELVVLQQKAESTFPGSEFVVVYPDGFKADHGWLEDAVDTAKEWMRMYPDEYGEYGPL